MKVEKWSGYYNEWDKEHHPWLDTKEANISDIKPIDKECEKS